MTFRSQPDLALHCPTGSQAGPIDGRRRLGGAFLIRTDRIRPDPSQPRKNLSAQAQEELDASVKQLGILQPITVRYVDRDHVYQVIAGERRFHAARNAGLQEIACWIQTPKEEDVLLHQIVKNWQRSDMRPFDLADALARLRDANGYFQKDLAKAIGKSKSEISKLLSLLDLDPKVQKIARHDQTGNVTKRHLYAVRTLSPGQQHAVIRKVHSRGLTATETESLVAKRTSRQQRPRPGAPVSYHRFKTSCATVSFTFRRKRVTTKDILSALDEMRAQLAERNENSL